MHQVTRFINRMVAVASTFALIGLSGAWVIDPIGTGYISVREIASAWQTTPEAVRTLVQQVLTHEKPDHAFELELKRKATWNMPCIKNGNDGQNPIEWFPLTGEFKTGLWWIPIYNSKGNLVWIRTKGYTPDVDGDYIFDKAIYDLHCPDHYHHAKYTVARPQLSDVQEEVLEANDVELPKDKVAP